MLFFTNIAIFDAFVPVLDHILMLFQAEICLCGRDRCNSEDPIPEVEMLATNPPVENSNIVGQKKTATHLLQFTIPPPPLSNVTLNQYQNF